MSRFVVFDVDSTLIQQEVIELLAEQAGVGEEVHAITSRAMAGDIDFSESLNLRVSLLRGLDFSCLDIAYRAISVTPGVPEVIRAIHQADGKVAAVSGGFIEILNPLAIELSLDYWRANTLEVFDGKLTGRVSGDVVDRKTKADCLVEWSKAAGFELSQTVAVGDGANDIDMFKTAGLAVAFRGKDIVRQAADVAIEENSMLPLLEILDLGTS